MLRLYRTRRSKCPDLASITHSQSTDKPPFSIFAKPWAGSHPIRSMNHSCHRVRRSNDFIRQVISTRSKAALA